MSRIQVMLLAVVLIGGGSILFSINPADVEWMPRCPFYALTGLKCPGCGTLRALHHLLHLRVAEAWRLNPLMIGFIPVVFTLIRLPKLRRSAIVGFAIAIAIFTYWIVRNL